MQQVVLRAFGRMKLNEKYPEWWTAIAEEFEDILLRQWLDDSCMGRASFVHGNIDSIAMFIEKDHLLAVETALDAKEEPSTITLKTCLESKVGSSMYKAQRLTWDWLQFHESVRRGINTLFHVSFSVNEYRNFQKLMRREVETLVKSVHNTFGVKNFSCRFLDIKKMPLDAANLNDAWRFPAEAEMKAIALNTGAVPWMPWEKLQFPERQVPEYASKIDIPEELLSSFVQVRKAV